ncbi:hypothetical protein B0I35DRAFT_427603 [Stachybotrys elegans]|uniref:AB hydrolase-1 domain-containing protein n=1 Tax=Stachybotrys elegans TaxID=80388 RepID=A0A8K0SYU0_9HYPO|nr:hypothetical protein B0I35DRAFT_427603 [Stachybotrys elegans]
MDDLPSVLADARFSREIQLQNVAGLETCRVKYADFGHGDEASGDQRVLLFMGPLFGTRWIHVFKDGLAKQHKVRMLMIDRPGFGGTDAVDIKQRLEATREIVVALLQRLEIRHVSVACQSAGTVYALDLLLHHPEILCPDRPYLAIGAPWIHPSHTDALPMAIASRLPAAALGTVDKLASFIQTTVNPIMLSGFGAAPAGEASEDDESSKLEASLLPKVMEKAFREGVHGMSDDVVVLMHKVEGTEGWSDWGDYDTLLPRLVAALQAGGKRLAVDIFFAEKDFLVGDFGKKGTNWLKACFERVSQDIELRTEVVPGSDHDSLWDLKFGIHRRVLAKMQGTE